MAADQGLGELARVLARIGGVEQHFQEFGGGKGVGAALGEAFAHAGAVALGGAGDEGALLLARGDGAWLPARAGGGRGVVGGGVARVRARRRRASGELQDPLQPHPPIAPKNCNPR